MLRICARNKIDLSPELDVNGESEDSDEDEQKQALNEEMNDVSDYELADNRIQVTPPP